MTILSKGQRWDRVGGGEAATNPTHLKVITCHFERSEKSFIVLSDTIEIKLN